MHLDRMYILLSWGGVFYRCLVDSSIVKSFASLLTFCLVLLSIIESGVLEFWVINIKSLFLYFVGFCFIYFLKLCLKFLSCQSIFHVI